MRGCGYGIREAAVPKLEALALARQGPCCLFRVSGQGLMDLTKAHNIYEQLGLPTTAPGAARDCSHSRRMGLYAEALATLNRLSEHFARSHDGFGSARLSDQLAMVYLQTGRYRMRWASLNAVRPFIISLNI